MFDKLEKTLASEKMERVREGRRCELGKPPYFIRSVSSSLSFHKALLWPVTSAAAGASSLRW